MSDTACKLNLTTEPLLLIGVNSWDLSSSMVFCEVFAMDSSSVGNSLIIFLLTGSRLGVNGSLFLELLKVVSS